MKKLCLILFLLLNSYSASFAGGEMVEIAVEGMTCAFCSWGLDRKLSKLPGVDEADVSLKKKRARLQLKPGATADIEAIKAMIIEAGFTPGEVLKQP